MTEQLQIVRELEPGTADNGFPIEPIPFEQMREQMKKLGLVALGTKQ